MTQLSEGILGLYDFVLPLLYTKTDVEGVEGKCFEYLKNRIQFDSYSYVVLNLFNERKRPDFGISASAKVDMGSGAVFRENVWAERGEPTIENIEEIAAKHRATMLDRLGAKYPEARGIYEQHWVTFEPPETIVFFYRIRQNDDVGDFSGAEMEELVAFRPHITHLLRLTAAIRFRERQYQYFDSLVDISARIASEHDLSTTEFKMMTELLSGRSNEEIAERNFISVATVKTHLQHIFKKTGTKNRVDFVGRYFTSPERVTL